MTEYIERKAAYQTLTEYYHHTAEGMHSALREAISRVPAADVRPVVHGEWLRTQAYPHRIYCSNCYVTFIRNDEFLELKETPHNYCPNCGADMREDENA